MTPFEYNLGAQIVVGVFLFGIAGLVVAGLLDFISGKLRMRRQRRCQHIWNVCVCEKCGENRHDWQVREETTGVTTITAYTGDHNGEPAEVITTILECVNCHETRKNEEIRTFYP